MISQNTHTHTSAYACTSATLPLQTHTHTHIHTHKLSFRPAGDNRPLAPDVKLERVRGKCE